MSGFGYASFGASPYGTGTPSVSYSPGGAALPLDNVSRGSISTPRGRWINPVTRRFEVDSNGQIVGMDSVQQQVYLALRTIRGTAIPEDLGSNILDSQDIGDDFDERMRVAVNVALSRLVASQLVSIIDVSTRAFSDNGRLITVRWRNLVNAREHSTTF